MQTMHHNNNKQHIMHDNLNFSTLQHTDQQTQNLQSPPHFTEDINAQGFPIIFLRTPIPFTDLQINNQHAITKFTNQKTIIVNNNRKQTTLNKQTNHNANHQHHKKTQSSPHVLPTHATHSPNRLRSLTSMISHHQQYTTNAIARKAIF